jgi:hypothetical protein
MVVPLEREVKVLAFTPAGTEEYSTKDAVKMMSEVELAVFSWGADMAAVSIVNTPDAVQFHLADQQMVAKVVFAYPQA